MTRHADDRAADTRQQGARVYGAASERGRAPVAALESVSFERRIAARVRGCLAEAQACSVLTLALLVSEQDGVGGESESDAWGYEAPGEAAYDLRAVAERARALVRRDDVIEVDQTQGAAFVLRAAWSDGARAVFLRLRDALDGCRVPTEMEEREPGKVIEVGQEAPRLMTMGYATLDEEVIAAGMRRGVLAEEVFERAVEAVVQSAREPRVVIRVMTPLRGDVKRQALVGGMRDGAEWLRAARQAERKGARALQVVNAQGPTTETRQVDGGVARLRAPQETRARGAQLAGAPFAAAPLRIAASGRRALAPHLARELQVVALGAARGSLTVAMCDPANTETLERLRAVTGKVIYPVQADPAEIERALLALDGGAGDSVN